MTTPPDSGTYLIGIYIHADTPPELRDLLHSRIAELVHGAVVPVNSSGTFVEGHFWDLMGDVGDGDAVAIGDDPEDDGDTCIVKATGSICIADMFRCTVHGARSACSSEGQ